MIKLTRAVVIFGTLSASACAHVPTGMTAFFNSASCPQGWADLSTDWRGRYVVIDPGRTGQVVGEALASGENRATGEHGHAVTPGERLVIVPRPGCREDNTCRRVGYYDDGNAYWEPENARLAIGAATTPAGETVRPGTNAPYVALRACAKG